MVVAPACAHKSCQMASKPCARQLVGWGMWAILHNGVVYGACAVIMLCGWFLNGITLQHYTKSVVSAET